MKIIVDERERALYDRLDARLSSLKTPSFAILEKRVLPLGDILLETDEGKKVMLIERKTYTDLLASIKDGRYEEQSYRLNGLSHHNHNIIYLIEGDVNKNTYFKSRTDAEKQMAYSAMFSLNYYKGFSVFRSFSLEETATIVCNMAYKLEKQKLSGKNEYYKNNMNSIDETLEEKVNIEETDIVEKSVKNYVNVIKKVKKENITPDNIGEIMLCQIPGVSSVTAISIMEQYKNMPNLIKELEINNDCLKNITSTNSKGQIRKINKTSISNIIKFLLKK